jgi:adenylate cyclase
MTATRRLAAILAADVAGYSRLIGADEEGTLNRLRSIRADVIDPKITEHRGRIVKTTGDGLLVEFSSVVDALRCATQWQHGMDERNAAVSGDNRIEFRIGVHQGDIVVENDDIFGDGVNVAARLEALAEPGGICISRVVRDQIRDKFAYAFEDLGKQAVKNIARPVRVYTMSAESVASLPTAEPGASPDTADPRRHWKLERIGLRGGNDGKRAVGSRAEIDGCVLAGRQLPLRRPDLPLR